MHCLRVIALLTGLSAASTIPGGLEARQATNGPRPGHIIWICTGNSDSAQDIPEVCKNMCYGAYCRGYGTSLTWDKYAGRSKDERAADAGCGKNNHCSTDPPGSGSFQCDEYPFGSTSDADRTDLNAVNRCVPSGQNNRQGARLTQLFNSNGPWKNNQGLGGNPPAQFRQSFSNAGNLLYCSGDTSGDKCLNDGLQYQKGGKIVDAISKRAPAPAPQQFKYRLRSGQVIEVPDEFEIGYEVLLPMEMNSTRVTELANSGTTDVKRSLEEHEEMVGHMYLEDDVVEELLN